MKKNIIFLDIDGVLVNRKSLQESASGWQAKADKECVKELNRVLEKTKAVLVISSSWRISQTEDEMKVILKKWGVKGEVIGMTPLLPIPSGTLFLSSERGQEILSWLENNTEKCLDFQILDDMDDMHPYKHRLVQTKFETGLTKVEADNIILRFKTPQLSSPKEKTPDGPSNRARERLCSKAVRKKKKE